MDGGAASNSYDPSKLSDGEHTVSVTRTDLAGNVSQAVSFGFTLDTVAPTAPTVLLTNDSGSSATDGVTKDASLTISGIEDGATLSYVVDGGPASASYDPTKLADGKHTVSVTQTDTAGNVSPGVSVSFTLDTVAPGSVQKLGGEFLVNTETNSEQWNPTITGLANGNFVIGWQDYSGTGGDTDGGGIKAQVFDAAGKKLGAEFLVNTETASWQAIPTITGLSNGGFVVCWQDYSGQGGDTSWSGIKAQVFDAEGNKLGAEFLVNTETASYQLDPRITGLSNGGFVVSWEDWSGKGGDTDGGSIKAQVFDAAGTKVGMEFLVDTQTNSDQMIPKITGLSNGSFVVSWQDSSGQGGDTSWTGIKAQVFDAAGDKLGGEFLINTVVKGSQKTPTITGLPNGNFVVSWEDASGQGGDASGTSIKGQVFSAAGDKVGGEFLVNTVTAEWQSAPTITGLSNGGFVVSWQDPSGEGGDASGYGVKAQAFSATGDKLGGEFLVNTAVGGDQKAPTITGLSNGNFVVSWQDSSGQGGDASGSSIKAQIFSTARLDFGVVLAEDTGASATDALTNDARLSLTGIEDGVTLSYVVDGGAASASYDPTQLSDGQHTVSVTQTDRAGNHSQAVSVGFTLDTVAPDAPPASLTTGTKAPTALLSGAATPGGTVAILDGGVEVARVSADASTGAYSFDFGTLGAGTHRFIAVVTDQAGNASSSGETVGEQVVAIGTGAEVAVQLDALAAGRGLAAIYITDGTRLVFSSAADMEHARQSDAAALAKIVGSYGFNVLQTVGGAEVVTLYDMDGHRTERTTTRSATDYTIDRYDAADKLASQTYVHDGVREEKNFAVTGKAYQRQEAVYDANDKLISMVRYYAEGNKMAFNSVKGADGSVTVKEWTPQGALTVNLFAADGSPKQQDRYDANGKHTYQQVRYADGSKAEHVFDAVSGEETSYSFINADRSRTESTYHITGKDYAEQTQTYDAAGHIVDGVRKYANGTVSFTEKHGADGSGEVHSYDTSARETQKLLFAADGSKDVFQFSYAGSDKALATAVQTHYGAGNVKQWTDSTKADGSHAQTAYVGGVTLVSHEKVADVFQGFKGGADTFVFNIGFGKDVVKGFEAGSGAVHDVLVIDDSYAADFASLQAKMTTIGSDTLIQLDADNSILLKNVASSAITADDVHLVHYDVLSV